MLPVPRGCAEVQVGSRCPVWDRAKSTKFVLDFWRTTRVSRVQQNTNDGNNWLIKLGQPVGMMFVISEIKVGKTIKKLGFCQKRRDSHVFS